jgi:hypothetical protein
MNQWSLRGQKRTSECYTETAVCTTTATRRVGCSEEKTVNWAVGHVRCIKVMETHRSVGQYVNVGWPDVLFLTGLSRFWGRCPVSRQGKTGRQIAPFSNSAVFYNSHRFFIMACKQQLELRCLEWKSPSYFNKPLHVLLSALLWFLNLNLSSNRAFCVSAVRERLQLMYCSWVTNKFKQWDNNFSRSIKIEVPTQKLHK